MADVQRKKMVSKVNDLLAIHLTMFVGTIWALFVIVIFGLTPVFCPAYDTKILYWSNFLQLVFMPIITLGTSIFSRDARARAEQGHEMIQQDFALLKDAQARC